MMTADPDITQRIARLTPLADVVARIDAGVEQVKPREVAVASAVGRVLAKELTVGPRPPVALALRDGLAVSADLTTDASSYAPVPLPAAIRIDAGKPIPAGADAVAPFDIVVNRSGRTEIIAPVASGEGVLPAGTDASRQKPLLQQGRRLTRVQAAVVTAAGVRSVAIREPRVRLARARAAGDAVMDAAISFIAGEIHAEGGLLWPDEHGNAGTTGLEAALEDEAADAVIAIGGTGSGRHDTSVRTLGRMGRVETHGIALAPGETAAFGFAGPRPVLLLPGRMDAAVAVWRVLGRHLLARLSGRVEEEPVRTARLARKVASTLGLTEMVPVRLRDGAAEPIASGYVPLSALAQAHGWILVPPDSEGYPSGAEVVIRPWS